MRKENYNTSMDSYVQTTPFGNLSGEHQPHEGVSEPNPWRGQTAQMGVILGFRSALAYAEANVDYVAGNAASDRRTEDASTARLEQHRHRPAVCLASSSNTHFGEEVNQWEEERISRLKQDLNKLTSARTSSTDQGEDSTMAGSKLDMLYASCESYRGSSLSAQYSESPHSSIEIDGDSVLASIEQYVPARASELPDSVDLSTSEHRSSDESNIERLNHILGNITSVPTRSVYSTVFDSPTRGWGWRPYAPQEMVERFSGQYNASIVKKQKYKHHKRCKRHVGKRKDSLHCYVPGQGWGPV